MLFLFSVILLDPLSSPIDSSPNSPPPILRDDADSEGISDSFSPLNRLYIYDIDPS